eukprot:CAMPEP_0172418094 /NCGR_PEP_ID=MMETSP1064-20121228/4618_1 /TAXON_ID=202472 /ORGANISM="Aulacoseira subarctica , Strain CCAP 1002/5" /LENGTH=100 /DNA_ID=CAMNT_0013156837 /DNA_START=461 /DNA_END=763 /DNA_ORIENTATION=+
MVTTELIVDVLNFFDEKPASETTTKPQVEPVVNSVEAPEVLEEPAILRDEEAEEDVPDLVDLVDASDDEDNDESIAEEVEPEPGIAARTRSRTGMDGSKS